MTRLTNALKDAIVNAALKKAGWTDANATLRTNWDNWIEAVRLASLGMPEADLLALEKKALKAISFIPKKFRSDIETILNRSRSLRFNAGGEQDWVYFSDGKGGQERRVRLDKAFVFTSDSPLFIERETLKAEDARLYELRETVSAQVRGALSAVNTVAQLLKVWPEAKELIPDHVPEAKPQLPAVQAADLNKLLGLPTEGNAQ